MDEITFYMTYQTLKKEYGMFFNNPIMLEKLLIPREFTPKQIIQLNKLFNDDKFLYIFEYLKAHNDIRGMKLN